MLVFFPHGTVKKLNQLDLFRCISSRVPTVNVCYYHGSACWIALEPNDVRVLFFLKMISRWIFHACRPLVSRPNDHRFSSPQTWKVSVEYAESTLVYGNDVYVYKLQLKCKYENLDVRFSATHPLYHKTDVVCYPFHCPSRLRHRKSGSTDNNNNKVDSNSTNSSNSSSSSIRFWFSGAFLRPLKSSGVVDIM